MNRTEELYYGLLKDWCDGLLSLQMPDSGNPEVAGSLVCPACKRIHGRSADAILPLMYMAQRTEDAKYLRSARALFRWSGSMYREGGYYINDVDNGWTGITVFFAIGLGEALQNFGHLLTEEERAAWKKRLFETMEYVREKIDKIGGTINYPTAGAHAMALAGQLCEPARKEAYFVRAKELADFVCGHIADNGMLFGEGHPCDALTAKGARAVDIGYNLEETIPALLEYSHLTQDARVEAMAMHALKTHLKFFLPDGGMDNSFGSRSYKWSYWGSRTSDGIQAAAALVGSKCPEFAKAARDNALLLRRCTRDGLLYGGPMFHEAGEKPCVHHTFCHAKTLAKALMILEKTHQGEIPCQGELDRVPVEYFPEVGSYLIRSGPWRATLTEYDYEYCPGSHATGGALTLLRHDLTGVLCAGTMNRYYVVEPNNMQILPGGEDDCLTPRIEYRKDGVLYRSISDLSADFHPAEGGSIFLAEGILRDEKQAGEEAYRIRYEFDKDHICITAESSADAEFILPIIAGENEEIQYPSEAVVLIKKEKADIVIRTDAELVRQEESHRIFNPVGGFLGFPVKIPMTAEKKTTVHIAVVPR